MKIVIKSALALLLAAALALGSCRKAAPPSTSAPVPAQTVAAPASERERVVYVTNTGKKHHAAGCRSLRRSAIPLPIDEAQAKGYQPCKICGGG